MDRSNRLGDLNENAALNLPSYRREVQRTKVPLYGAARIAISATKDLSPKTTPDPFCDESDSAPLAPLRSEFERRLGRPAVAGVT